MAVFLNEREMGADTGIIGFPHLVLCMGVVLQANRSLYGFHFDSMGDEETLEQALHFHGFLNDCGANAANAVRLYGASNWDVRYDRFSVLTRKRAWQNQMRLIANRIGFHGPVTGFNTACIAPRQGTYVEYRPEFGRGRCRIFYKRNEKVNFASQTPNEERPFGGRMASMIPMFGVTTNATVQGTLHEVNYFLRTTTFEH